MEFKKYKMEDIATFSQGKQVEIENQYTEQKENMKRFLRIIDFTNPNEPIRYVEDFGDRYYATKDDLVMIRYGSQTCGKVVIGKEGIIANNMFKINLDNSTVLNRYAYYYLKQDTVYNYLRGSQNSSTMPSINFGILNKLEIEVPSIDNQKKIIKILNDIDQKIELNNEINNNLSEQIKYIYNDIFTDYEDYKRLDEISNVTIGKTPPRSEQECFTTNKNDVKWVSISDLGKSGMFIFDTSEKLTQEAVNKYNVKVIPKDTVILSFKLTVGRTGFTTEDMTTNEAIAHFDLNNKELNNYLYCTLTYFNYSDLGSTSSIATAINSKIVKSIKIGIPSDEKLNKFNNLTSAMFRTIKNNESENIKLSALRDTLLPKLMNGEIDLDNIEI